MLLFNGSVLDFTIKFMIALGEDENPQKQHFTTE